MKTQPSTRRPGLGWALTTVALLAGPACDEESPEQDDDETTTAAGGKGDDVSQDPCAQAPGCNAGFLACMAGTVDDREFVCPEEFAACLAVEGLPLRRCSSLQGEDRTICDACSDLPECEEVEDGADVNACLAATARCQSAALGLFPGGCVPPQVEEPIACEEPECAHVPDADESRE